MRLKYLKQLSSYYYMGASQSVISQEDFKNYLYGTTVLMLAPRLDSELQFKDCSQISDEDQHVLPFVLDSKQPPRLDEVIKAYTEYYGNSGKEEAIDKYVKEHILDTDEHIQIFMKHLVGLLQDRHSRVETEIKRLTTQPTQPTQPQNHQPTQSVRSTYVPHAPHVPVHTQVQAQHIVGAPSVTSSRRHRQAPVPVPVPQQGAAPQYYNQPPVPHQATQQQTTASVTVQPPAPQQQQVPPQPVEQPAQPQQPLQAPPQPAHRIRGHGKLQRRMQNVNEAIDREQLALQAQLEHEQELQINKSHQQPTPPPELHKGVYDEDSTQEGEFEETSVFEKDMVVSEHYSIPPALVTPKAKHV